MALLKYEMEYKSAHITNCCDKMPYMPKIIEMKGRVFGCLTVLSRVAATGQARWLCACKCGNETIQPGYELRNSSIISCGCARLERCAELNKTHGMTGTKTYRAWTNMRNRCSRTEDKSYSRYGALGVIVCDSWQNSFENFLADMGECPSTHSLDRIDPTGTYCPINCRWADLQTQQNNKRRIKTATINGITKPIAVWTKELNLSHRTIRARIYERHWTPENAILTPIKTKPS